MADSGPLSPSPARPPLRDRLMMLSSSPLPEIHELLAKKPRTHKLKSGSAAAPIPAHANTTFTRASDLLLAAQAAGDDSFDPIDEREPFPAKKAPARRSQKPATRNAKPSTAPKRAAKEVIVLSSDGLIPDSVQQGDFNPAAGKGWENGEGVDGEMQDTPQKARPWKKYKVAREPSPPAEKEGVVEAAKPRTNTKKPKSQQKKEPEIVSRHFSKDTPAVEKPKRKGGPSRVSTPEPMNLEPAIQRRLDWTPPRQNPTLTAAESEYAASLSDGLAPEDEGTDRPTLDTFKKLQDTFGHKVEHEIQSASQQQPVMVLGKSKIIDLISTNHSSGPTGPGRKTPHMKEKAPKKKPRTITELATAPYVVKTAEPADDQPRGDSLLEYFRVGGTDQDSTKAAGGKGKGNAAKVTKSKKKAQPKKPVLLSPRTAMKRSAAQDFVFGTSSQLAREKSPTLLRDLHEALKASAMTDEEDPFASSEEVSKMERPGKGLWSVSARDQAGEMMNVEVIDLVDSSTFPEDDAILDPWKQLAPEPAAAESVISGSSALELGTRRVITIEDDQSWSSVANATFDIPTTQRKITVNTAAVTSPRTSAESFPLLTDLLDDEMPPPSNQQQTQEERPQASSSRAATSPQKPRPKFELFTDAKLAKEVSKFGFKAVKTRNAMISLLDQCWRSKNQVLGQTAPFSTGPVLNSPKRKQPASPKEDSAASAPPAKKPRGRPKKATTAAGGDGAEAEQNTEVLKGAGQGDAPATPKMRGRPRKKDAAAVEETGTSMSPLPPAPSPRARRGTSTPKRKKAAHRPVREMQDSDLDSEGETGVSSPEQQFSPADNQVSISDDTEISLALSPSGEQSALFSLITRAVTSAPRTSDPSKPSWHEKMLMYDPIILEDLAAWLNSGQLARVGHDGEVSPQVVKKWCESRSICCLWKVNIRGKERKRF